MLGRCEQKERIIIIHTLTILANKKGNINEFQGISLIQIILNATDL